MRRGADRPIVSVFIQQLDRSYWQELAPLFCDYNYRQLWAFEAACARRYGAANERVAVMDGGDVLGIVGVRIKRLPFCGGGIAYVTGGPLVRRNESSDPLRFEECMRCLADQYAGRGRLVLRVSPPIGRPAWNAEQASIMERLGFRAVARSSRYRTLVLGIDRSPDEIRKGFDQKWRNCLNRSEKNGLSVRCGESQALFDEFCGVYDRLIIRKRFHADLDAGFYAGVHAALEDGERFQVMLADADGEAVAGCIMSTLGSTCVYLLGASTEKGLQLRASYLLQWHAIRVARERCCRWYDLGGIDPDSNPGVYHFKRGLGGEEILCAGPFEKWPGPLMGRVIVGAEQVYRRLRGAVLHGER